MKGKTGSRIRSPRFEGEGRIESEARERAGRGLGGG